MRKLFILCIGIFFAQQAAATSQCSFKAEADIHCDNCITLHDFALFGAAALSGNYGYFSDAISPTGKTIRVTGNNGSNVVVTKRPAWDPTQILYCLYGIRCRSRAPCMGSHAVPIRPAWDPTQNPCGLYETR